MKTHALEAGQFIELCELCELQEYKTLFRAILTSTFFDGSLYGAEQGLNSQGLPGEGGGG